MSQCSKLRQLPVQGPSAPNEKEGEEARRRKQNEDPSKKEGIKFRAVTSYEPAKREQNEDLSNGEGLKIRAVTSYSQQRESRRRIPPRERDSSQHSHHLSVPALPKWSNQGCHQDHLSPSNPVPGDAEGEGWSHTW
jgi:hypothetical protein